MLKAKIISPKELQKFGSVENLNEQAKTLVAHQKSSWELARLNFDALQSVQTNIFSFDHFSIKTQFNPERIRSSAAKTDVKSISKRLCFLCLNNLPEQQSGLVFQGNYLILANPFPIFPIHLTISHEEHTPQEIRKYFSDMLALSKELPDFTIFYNGPKTGASAPDHFHFQAIIKNSLPIEDEFSVLENQFSEIIFQDNSVKIIAVENNLRRFITIISNSKKEIEKKFEVIYEYLKLDESQEPMLNVLSSFHENKWSVIVFPRDKQRPSHFYGTGESQILVSPAAVEMGGVLVLPRKEDFENITKKEIAEIYDEVTISNEKFKNLIDMIKKVDK